MPEVGSFMGARAPEKEVDVDNIFTDVRDPPTARDATMRINIYAHDGLAYTSLLTQPITIDNHLAAGSPHNLISFVKPDYVIKPNSIVVVQREYFQETDFPNLVSLDLWISFFLNF